MTMRRLGAFPHVAVIPGVSYHRTSGVIAIASFSVNIWPGVLDNADFDGTLGTREPAIGTLATHHAVVSAVLAVTSTVVLSQTIQGVTYTIDSQALNVGAGSIGQLIVQDKRLMAAGYATLTITVTAGTGAYFLNLQTVCQ